MERLLTPILADPGDHTGLSANPVSTPAQRKLRKAAGEFESMLFSSLWKSMKSTVAGQEDSGAGETLQDLGIQAMSQAIADAGGVGIANLIVQYLQKPETHPPRFVEDVSHARNGKKMHNVVSLKYLE